MMISKIAEQFLSRQACIYIRLSTMGQVRFNQESTERQYNLASKAQSLGWSSERIRILDRDLGQSGARTTNREDFKTLVIIRARLHGGKLNKAHKGELHFALPVGFVFGDDKIALDPDQEVQSPVPP